jgi:hypothetical protein
VDHIFSQASYSCCNLHLFIYWQSFHVIFYFS